MKQSILVLSFVIGLAGGCSSDATRQQEEQSAGSPAESEIVRAIVNEDRRREGRETELDLTGPAVQDAVMPGADRDRQSHDPAPIIAVTPPPEVPHSPAIAPSRREVFESAAGRSAMKQSSNLALVRRAQEPLYREQYQRPADNRVTRVLDRPVSTFSIDVDTGAYSNARRFLNQGQLPPEDAVRVEEFINYFDYDYRVPSSRGTPFLVETEVAPTPWNRQTHLFRIGIQGYEVPRHQLPLANLVFLVDVSGSMRSHDKLPLLKQSLGMLAEQLSHRDCISLVVYAGSSGVVLPPTPGSQKHRIIEALQRLEAGGSTNGAAGIRLAYQMARQNFRADGVNRVILATDGDFNVGLASTEELVDMVQRQREAGIALTTLGFGSGNYNDHLMERLADEGNGNHAYIDQLSEARKVLSEQLSATLMTIASDVKIQVEFNSDEVTEYRLIGYENRALNEEDFNNDRIDAGEIGAGHRVTALYEISLADSGYRRLPERRYDGNRDHADFAPPRAPGRELAHLRIRYKAPGQDRSKLIEAPVMRQGVMHSTQQASDDFRFAAAVAAFGQKLRGGAYLEGYAYQDILDLAQAARGRDAFGYRSEFLQLVSQAQRLDLAPGYAMRDDRG